MSASPQVKGGNVLGGASYWGLGGRAVHTSSMMSSFVMCLEGAPRKGQYTQINVSMVASFLGHAWPVTDLTGQRAGPGWCSGQ